MKVTIVSADDRMATVEIDIDAKLEDLKVVIESELGVPRALQQLLFNGMPLLQNSATLGSIGVSDGDLLFAAVMENQSQPQASSARAPPGAAPTAQPSAANTPSANLSGGMASLSQLLNPDGTAKNPEELRNLLRADQATLTRLLENDHPLGAAILGDDLERFQEALKQLHEQRRQMHLREQNTMALLAADPMDPDTQRKIEENIRQENIEENYLNAMEHNPEQFVAVDMLYVDMEVNNKPIKAFIDSGAQSTIMSRACVERCGVLRLLDTRYQGVAMGVGRSKIVGRIHAVQLKIGSTFFMCSITVLEADNMDFLFGLDMLRKHQCCIDLQKNVLRLGVGDICVPFVQGPPIRSHMGSELATSSASPAGDTATGVAASSSPASASTSASAGTTSATITNPQAGYSPAPPTQALSGNSALEVKIQRLMELGHDRVRCEQALVAANGNEEDAAGFLFGM